jgi:hypothetical protein
MNTRSLYFLFVIVLSSVVFSCKQDKKTEAETTQKIPVAVSARSRYQIGDSIAIGFTQPVTQYVVKWNGAELPGVKQNSDSVFVKAESEKTGWKQIIVSGKTKSNEVFADRILYQKK